METRAPATIAVMPAGDSPPFGARARSLAGELNLPLIARDEARGFDLVLAVTEERMELREGAAPGKVGVFVDFSSLDIRPGGAGVSRRQPLARAMGRGARTVVDATAGLGYDAFLLAGMGWNVTAIERSPVIAALLRDGLRRAQDDARTQAIGDRLQVVVGDAREVVASLDPPPDVIYLDPMFPPKRRKSALAKREIRLVRAVVGEDEDAGELFAIARKHARARVVVKRPGYAPPLAPEPAVSFEGKLARYDVYPTR